MPKPKTQGQKMQVSGIDGNVTVSELKRATTAFQYSTWKRIRHTCRVNKVDFKIHPGHLPRDLPPYCALLKDQALDHTNYVVARIDTRKPMEEDNFLIVSRRAYNALNAGLTPEEWKEFTGNLLIELKDGQRK